MTGSVYFARTGAPVGAWFDSTAADRACGFIETFCVQSKGEWAGQPLKLQGWQKTLLRDVFGWKRKDGYRLFRSVYIEIPRKNGKSSLSSALALYMLFADGEMGAEIYCAAGDREQARIVFDECKAMIDQAGSLKRRAKAYKGVVLAPGTHSKMLVLSAEAYSKHGLNASAIIFDELHVQPNRELYDVLRTSTGARRQPLLVMLTTAGFDRTSICWEQHERSVQTMADPLLDPTHYGIIYGASESDDWTDPAVWAKANPNLGVTISQEYLEAAFREAELQPGMQNGFRRLHLNIWTSSDVRWLDMEQWDACRREEVDLEGRACYGGLDLASKSDMAAFALVFAPMEQGEPYHVRVWYWIPGDNIERRALQSGVPYDVWERQELLKGTPGNVIDYDTILADVLELAALYDVREVAFDRWGATLISQQMTEAGLLVVEFGQGFASMAAPMREVMRMVANGELAHDGNAILRWNIDNVSAEQDAAGNLKPSKRKSAGKIDGMVAVVMGLDRALRNEGAAPYYAQGGLVLA